MKMYGDERLDNWVRKQYGEDCDWVFLKNVGDEYEDVKETLPNFVVLDDDGEEEVGIAIIHKNHVDGDEFIRCCEDDNGVLCWEFENEGFVSEADYEELKNIGKLKLIAFIENHDEFEGWKDKCEYCWSSEERCTCLPCKFCEERPSDCTCNDSSDTEEEKKTSKPQRQPHTHHLSNP